jgi:hypothetical protein
MANQIIPRNPATSLTRQTTGNFGEGVMDSFPRLSIRGGKFHVRMNQQEYPAGQFDPNLGAVVEVVLLNASRQLAKSYYDKPFASADSGEAPLCWSLDSIRPDPSVAFKQNDLCQTCKKNEFGSSPSGRGGKACQDSRRVIITTKSDLEKGNGAMLVLRVPQQSLKNLKNHTEALAEAGWEPCEVVTRMSFDRTTEYPKLQFEFWEALDPKLGVEATNQANGNKVGRMLMNPDFDAAASPLNLPVQQQVKPAGIPTKPVQPTGFGPGLLQEEPEPETVEEVWEDLGDGTELNLATGEVRAVATVTPEPEPVPDPDVLTTSDGRFYNRRLKKFVDGPYLNAVPKPVSVSPPVKAEAPKRRGRPKAEEAKPAEKPVEATTEAKPNGETKPKPTVVAASPKLEALLGSLVPHEDEK